MNKKTLSILLASWMLQAPIAHALTGLEIMTRNEDARKVNEFESRAKLESGNTKDASTKIKEFSFWRKVQSDGIHNSTFTRFHAPAEVRNEGILIVENGSGKNDVLLYLPAYKKIRRVESQQQSGSFMGSVFSYSDIATPHVDEYQYRVMKEESCPTPESASVKCYVVEALPANDTIKERTGYSKSVAWVRHDNFMVVKGEYYNLEGALFKRLEASQIKLVDPKNQKWLSHSLYIIQLKTGDFTRLEFSKVKVNGGIADAIFTQQNLQKVN
ncbi:outer membrane lipoprotein-sorting protein [bacterium]|nr:outer membrane lipoprotein-sorting protein [bacterium]